MKDEERRELELTTTADSDRKVSSHGSSLSLVLGIEGTTRRDLTVYSHAFPLPFPILSVSQLSALQAGSNGKVTSLWELYVRGIMFTPFFPLIVVFPSLQCRPVET